eukprot:scaffold1307_cov200-Pinguiococcus_pyrenoidosus.AAC.48
MGHEPQGLAQHPPSTPCGRQQGRGVARERHAQHPAPEGVPREHDYHCLGFEERCPRAAPKQREGPATGWRAPTEACPSRASK